MARIGRSGFLAIAVVFHMIYTYSIFDIYFVSPIVSGMKAFEPLVAEAPAKRLVLFVGDGLRADKAFQSFPDPSPGAFNNTDAHVPRRLAPFLRSKVLNDGTFGVSHTRVPTESRPGHVALIAGLYEDVSAVTTGWSHNPVNFDSVFNRSRHTWSWGSPDIVPMFKDGAEPGRVDAFHYPPSKEDFSKDSTELDTWVFEHVQDFFHSASTNVERNAILHQDKIVFFLHLLGLDTVGHNKRPYSREYLHNIQVVDEGVKEITDMVDRFYGDDKTAYVFTADHGMSDWGSHGDGHPDNTRTPLIAWGSGVSKPVLNATGVAQGHEDGFSYDWGFDHVQRNDVAQADIAALMAHLVGIPFPVNSVGELPLSYLDAAPPNKARAMLTNAQEILEMYRVKESRQANTKIQFKSFEPFSLERQSPEEWVQRIQLSIDLGKHDQAIQQAQQLIQVTLNGLRYLQTYDWLFLRTLVSAGYLGWIAFALTTIFDTQVLHGKTIESRTTMSTMFFSSILIGLFSFLYIQKSPWTYYAYAIFPVMFWEEVFARRQALLEGRKALLGYLKSYGDYFDLFFKTIAFIAIIEALVAAYFFREVFTVCYFLATVWPLIYGFQFVGEHFSLVASWVACCALMATFTLLPVIKAESITMIVTGGVLMSGVGVAYLLFEDSIIIPIKLGADTKAATKNTFSRTILGVQTGLVALSILTTYTSVTSLQARQGLPLGSQVVGWIALVSSLVLPFLHGRNPNNHYLHRLIVIFLAFAPTFIILTISYEGLFYLAFCLTVLTWVRMEHHIFVFTNPSLAKATGASSTSDPRTELDITQPAQTAATQRAVALTKEDYRSLTLSDFRIALFFLFLLQSAFFSTGNIASISSFELDAVVRLIPVFGPFSQGALLVLKLLIPFAVISANLGILNRRVRLAPSAVFMAVTAISDIMTLNFFYMVKDEGSWLEIGSTISQFVIASVLCVFVAGLEFLSEIFVKGVEFSDEMPIADPIKQTVVNGSARLANGTPTANSRHVAENQGNGTTGQ